MTDNAPCSSAYAPISSLALKFKHNSAMSVAVFCFSFHINFLTLRDLFRASGWLRG